MGRNGQWPINNFQRDQGVDLHRWTILVICRCNNVQGTL